VKFLGYIPDQPANANLGLQIRSIRRSLGIEQDVLARQLGVDPSTLGRWEQGKGQPQAKNMKKVTEFVKTVSLDREL
jgi:DNA-binding transcriptional regulator YiaG